MSEVSVLATQTLVDSQALALMIKRYINDKGWLFLRWPHKVTMLPLSDATAFECQQGQAFDQRRELRWKQKGEQYEVLLLSENKPTDEELTLGNVSFCPVGDQWLTKILNAEAHSTTETRFPKGVDMPKSLNLEQRYFIDEKTACVQFVALKVK